MRHWLRIKTVTRTAAVVGATWAVLIASVMMGLQLPVLEVLEGLRNRGLDYSALPETINPLSEEFIERVLGPRRDVELAGLAPATRTIAGAVGDERSVVKHQLTNDDPATAYAVGSIPFTAQTDVSTSTRNGDPEDCSSSGNTVWYSYKPTSDLGLIAYTFGTSHAVDLAAFQHEDGRWQQVPGACHRGEHGNALIQFPAKAGSVYYFQVASPPGEDDLRFSLDPRGTTRLVSHNKTGEPAGSDATLHNASPDGRLVAFESFAPDLVDRDASCPTRNEKALYKGASTQERHNCRQVYLRDVISGRTTLVSSTEDGTPGDAGSREPFLSGNKRFVVFASMAWNLAPNDPDGRDLYVKDLETGAVEMIVSSAPVVSSDPSTKIAATPVQHAVQNIDVTGSWWPTMSDDGRYVAFQSILALIPEDKNETWDVYVFDRSTRSLERASVNSSEEESQPLVHIDLAQSHVPAAVTAVDLAPSISATGRYVVFRSPARNLVEGGSNGTWHTYVRDRLLGTTERVSVNSRGEQADERSVGRRQMRGSTISADGRYVVFSSVATNLVESPQHGEFVYLRDRQLGTTRRIGSGPDTSGESGRFGTPKLLPYGAVPSISRNGRFIVYVATVRRSTPLCIADDERGQTSAWRFCNGDVLVYDRLTDTTVPITQQDAFAGIWPVVSEDGRFVSFQSDAEGSDALQIFTYEAARAR